jgi:hypothetical protein
MTGQTPALVGYLPPMAGPLADALFVLAALAIALSHVLIVRSTIRGMGGGRDSGRDSGHPALPGGAAARGRVREIVWAVLPAVVLALLLVWTWRTMHPETMQFQLPADRPIGGITT